MSQILAICGSLRTASLNRAALRALISLCPEVAIEIRLLHNIPMYDADAIETSGVPPAVASFRAEIAAADAILFATPEYSHSVSGVLKNALDWLHGKPPYLADKPVAILSAASSPIGGLRAQYNLREIVQPLGAHVLGMPEMAIGNADRKFDSEGVLTDAPTADALCAFMRAYVTWIRRLGDAPPPT